MSDWYDEEFGVLSGRRKHPIVQWDIVIGGRKNLNLSNTTIESIDWRNKTVLQGVKYQGQCGSCWAFAAIGAIEAVTAIHSGTRQALSEQQIIDCVNIRHVK